MTLSASSAERISLLYDVAKSQGSSISLREVVALLPESVSEGEVEQAIRLSPALSTKFELHSGFITEKSNPDKSALLQAQLERRRIAMRNISYATEFVPLLHSTSFALVSVSGSTSYLAASRTHDLDLFCVARPGRLWSSLATALLLARIFRLFRREAPLICISCVMDEAYAEKIFSQSRDPLFARDALSAVVVQGGGTYQSLMKKANWINSLYPVAYSQRTKTVSQASEPAPESGRAGFLLERFLNLSVESYVRLKSFLLNRRFARVGREDGLFRILTGPDHLIYESRRYSGLRSSYGALRGG